MPQRMSWSLLLLVVLARLASGQGGQDWSSNCSQACKCKWVSSRKTAECTNASLSAVPSDLSHEVQALYLAGNTIPVITDNAFSDVKLVNLHKLSLRDCGVREIGKRGFSGLAILIELDLSNNQIVELHPLMFAENLKLRVIYLDHNLIQKVPDGMFREMKQLQTVQLNDNQIEQIGYKAFVNVPAMHTLTLHSNRLVTLHPDPFYPLQKLSSLVLHNNPWRCDCQLAPLRDWAVHHNLYTAPTQCEEPEKLKGMLWNDLTTDMMACMPRIIFPPQGATFEATDGEVTMSCQVEGNPPPTAHWVHESRVLSNNSDRFVIHEGPGGWLNVTLWDVGPEERGDYRCVAKNEGGMDERSVTLLLDSEEPFLPLGKDSGSTITGSDTEASHLPLIVALGVGATILAALLIGLSCWLCRSGRVCYVKKVTGDGNSSAGIHNGSTDEQEKGLITKINPVQKPPRRIDSASSTGDLAEMKKTLIDNGSVFSPSIIDSEDPIQERSLDSLDSTLCGVSSQRPRGQPDLLSFPGQVSPAGSSASTVPDSSRLPPQHGPQSPPPQPYVMVTPHAFGTLPYSRSQSPFSPAAIAVPPRSANGYVTIPRRPRVPSWSSPPTPLQLQLELPPRQPTYDNLGPRTTADGSSVLSLNRAGLPAYYSPVPLTMEGSGWTPRSVTDSVTSQNCLDDVASIDSPVAPKALKVPPKPPPKPKKKPADSVSGPLYEDEGEDGTEV